PSHPTDPPPTPQPSPPRRSSDLDDRAREPIEPHGRANESAGSPERAQDPKPRARLADLLRRRQQHDAGRIRIGCGFFVDSEPASDRKSTRLNSSHLGISYAVFRL